jgi:hypothetical protein
MMLSLKGKKKCKVKPYNEGILKLKRPRTRPLASLAWLFGNVPHPWDLPIVKHGVTVTTNLNISRSWRAGGVGS